MQTPRTEFAQALRAIAAERGLDADVIIETIRQAIIAAYKRDARERGEETEEMDFEVNIDPGSGEAQIYSWPLEKPEERKDVTPPGFGRIAAQTAKQVIHQKIREAEKGAIMGEYEGRVGTLISGMILRFDGPDVRVDLGKTEGIMPASERVPNERLNSNQRLTFFLKEIGDSAKGKQLILSRAEPSFVSKLFAREVPEISSGSVEVKAIAREPGVRTKIAVFSNQSGVDPVGSCVGQKGVRVQAVTNELGGERIDIIPWNEKTEEFIEASLAPAEGISVKLDEKTRTAKVTAPEDQLSLAIGRDGQNARLSAKLTGWKIEVKSSGEKLEKEDEEKTEAAVTKETETATKTKKVAQDKIEAKKEKSKAKKGADDKQEEAVVVKSEEVQAQVVEEDKKESKDNVDEMKTPLGNTEGDEIVKEKEVNKEDIVSETENKVKSG